MLAHGFARVRCESCKDELLVAFNYDALSFNLLEEGSLVFEDPQAAREMEAFFLEDLKHATEVHAQ